MNQHEADMELAFAHARSKDKICGICMEVVMVRNISDSKMRHVISKTIRRILKTNCMLKFSTGEIKRRGSLRNNA